MRRNRQQAGAVYPDGGFWYLRYYVDRVIGGQEQRKRLAKQLAPRKGVSKKHARELAKEYLDRVNKPKLKPHTAVTLVDFVETVYFPRIKENGGNDEVRPSTLRGYRTIWEKQLRPHCKKLWLRETRTSDCQELLDKLASEDRLNINSLKHAKAFLSGVFRVAVQLNFYAGDIDEKGKANTNPLRLTTLPRKARPANETFAYSLEEIELMLSVLPEPAATIVATAAYTGARRGEIRGMSWENYHDGEIFIAQSVWQGIVTDPKSEKSKAPVPIIRRLADRLEFHRARLGNPESGPMFPNEAGKPVDLNNVLCRCILPALRKAGVVWRGWHGFRRGLASNLKRLGVPDTTIQAILRHEDVSTTQKCYIKTVPADVRAAMEKFESSLDSALLDSNRPVKLAVPASNRTM